MCLHKCTCGILVFAEDEVYLTNEDERSEYVLNTSGSIWRGTYNNFFAGSWQFDQVSLRNSHSSMNQRSIYNVADCSSSPQSFPFPPPSLLPSQFESYSLNTALYLLDQSGLESELRRSPVHVSRTLTTMVGGGAE